MNHRTIGTVVFAQSTPKIQIFRARPARHAHAAPHEQFSSQSPPHAHVAQSHIGVGGVVVFVVFVVFFAFVVVVFLSQSMPNGGVAVAALLLMLDGIHGGIPTGKSLRRDQGRRHLHDMLYHAHV